ncbi:MAG: sugar ABC transporter permease [Thermomicrobiales bacterium]|nr:sugar ABC transporter permease [Thermomicrobiales bacterium]MCO5219279.1 sugar ABC transporter permease [Thermomicrobiales bacterium]
MAAASSQPDIERARKRGFDRAIGPLLLSPSVILLAIFVYGFIGTTVWISMSNWDTAIIDWSIIDPFWKVYDSLFHMTRFQINIRNTLIFTVFFLILAVGLGLTFAILLDRHMPGNALFRNVFLFPYALSFVVTGVAWRWIFNPETGINILFNTLGINWVLEKFGMGPFAPKWITDPRVMGDLGNWLPLPDFIKAQLGFPMAMLPVIIAAVWQLSGFAMAMYLSGLAAISDDVREAASLDGAGTIQLYRDIMIPLLKPITISTLIILGHVSLKIFDLVYAMSGRGPGYATEVPGIFMFDKTFKVLEYNTGAAASVVMLFMVSLVIVPYLARSMKDV